MFLKTLRMAASVFLLILASAVPASAQANVFVTGNTSFTVTWQGVKEGATLLARATFTVSNWTGNVIRDDGHQRQRTRCRQAPTSTHGLRRSDSA